MAHLQLTLFGSPQLEQAGQPVAIGRRKGLALLAYLALTKRGQHRDTLATLLWPDAPQQRARRNLRQVLSDLNKVLDKEWLLVEAEQITLVQNDDLGLDVARFQTCLALSQAHDHLAEEVCPACLPLLQEAADLYQADFLEGFTLRDAPEFDDWQFFQGESLRQDLAVVLERLVQGYKLQDKYEAALPYARRWLSLDPLHEPVHRELMWLYAQTNQQAAALRQYEECVRLLDEEFGLPPEMETTTLYEAIKAKRLMEPLLAAMAQPPVPTDKAVVENQESSINPASQVEIPSSHKHLPVRLGRYELLAEIGRGGFATVYRTRDRELDRLVALKELKPALVSDTHLIKRFRREAKLIAHLDHAHIVPIYDVGQVQGRHFIVMRLVEGQSLAERLSTQGRLTWTEAIEGLRTVAAGLDYAHRRGILHRDLKPANILLDPVRGSLLSDFGLAKLVDENSRSLN